MDKAHHLSCVCVSNWDTTDDYLGSHQRHNGIYLFLDLQPCSPYVYILDCCFFATCYHAIGDTLQATSRCGSSLSQSDPSQRIAWRKRICSTCLETLHDLYKTWIDNFASFIQWCEHYEHRQLILRVRQCTWRVSDSRGNLSWQSE